MVVGVVAAVSATASAQEPAAQPAPETGFGLPPPDTQAVTPAATPAAEPAEPAAAPPESEAPPAAEAPDDESAAQRQFYPYRCRPLTLPDRTLRIDAVLLYSYVGDTSSIDDTFFSFVGGLAYAATPDFEIGGVLLPLTLSPGGEYTQPSLYGLYRFLESQSFELGARLTLAPGLAEELFAFDVSLEALSRVGAVRFDIRGGLAVQTSEPARTIVHGELFATWQAARQFFVGAQTGARLYDGAHLDVPLGFYLGLTIDGSLGPGGDIRIGILFPEIRDGVELYTVGLGANFFSYLGQS